MKIPNFNNVRFLSNFKTLSQVEYIFLNKIKVIIHFKFVSECCFSSNVTRETKLTALLAFIDP